MESGKARSQQLAHQHPAKVGDADATAVDERLVVGERKTVMHTLLKPFFA